MSGWKNFYRCYGNETAFSDGRTGTGASDNAVIEKRKAGRNQGRSTGQKPGVFGVEGQADGNAKVYLAMWGLVLDDR